LSHDFKLLGNKGEVSNKEMEEIAKAEYEKFEERRRQVDLPPKN